MRLAPGWLMSSAIWAAITGCVARRSRRRWRPDTHGATELVFALFDLLGLSFIPRLRDAGELRLHRIGTPTGLAVDELLTSKIRPGRITDRYDDLLRVAGSLKRGWVPASLLISRMQAASPKPPLAAALAEYGRVVRTNFLLAYLADAPPRRRIGAQLNKGETMHALRRHVAFCQRQQLPADEDDHRRHALCLEVVTNAILAWNARYLTAALDDVHRRQPELIRDHALAQLSPVGHAHVNPNGRYRFDASAPPAGSGRYASTALMMSRPRVRAHRCWSTATNTQRHATRNC